MARKRSWSKLEIEMEVSSLSELEKYGYDGLLLLNPDPSPQTEPLLRWNWGAKKSRYYGPQSPAINNAMDNPPKNNNQMEEAGPSQVHEEPTPPSVLLPITKQEVVVDHTDPKVPPKSVKEILVYNRRRLRGKKIDYSTSSLEFDMDEDEHDDDDDDDISHNDDVVAYYMEGI